MIELRRMTADDLPLVARWLREPHVARWWLPDATATAEAELDELRGRVVGRSDRATRMLTILERSGASGTPIGWCQWYPYAAYPAEAEVIGAGPGDCGIDYAIGDPTAVGRGLGTQLIAVLVDEVRRHHREAGVIVDPDARNVASRRALERNGFTLVGVRPVTSELNDHPLAIYRLVRSFTASGSATGPPPAANGGSARRAGGRD